MTIKHQEMKKQLSLLAALLLTITSFSFAQNADAEVKKIVKNFRDPKNVALSFTYQYVIDDNDNQEAQKGEAYFQGESYKIIMKEQQTISDGKTIWTYLVDDGECMVSDASEGNNNTPLKLLTTLDKEYTSEHKPGGIIELTNPKGEFKKVILRSDLKRYDLLAGIDVFADDGSKLVINFLETKINQELGKDFFTFDEKAYPNVEIIDMR